MTTMRLALLAGAAGFVALGQQYRQPPPMQAVPLPGGEISFQRDGKELLRYRPGGDHRRPFWYPLTGPSGHGLTRMGHPGDPAGHSHHNSLWFSLNKVDGIDFWGDRGGRIVHARTEHLQDGDAAQAVTLADWIAPQGAVLLRERRHAVVRPLGQGEWLLSLELELTAAKDPVTLDAAQFGPIGVRMAKWIGAYHGGGRILNSAGATGEPAIFRKPARWVDYSGQPAAGVVEGIALFDHPSNPAHPSPFHVREDGWMGAMLSLERASRIEAGNPMRLRYGLWIHSGAPAAASIESMWKRYAALPLRPPVGPPESPRDCLHGSHKNFTNPREFRSAADCTAFVNGK